MADFDLSELNRLAVDLGRGTAAMVTEARTIIQVASTKIKRDMAREIGRSPHFKAVAPAISYDLKGLSAEIGPVIGKAAGSLAFIAANGTATTPPSWEYTAALHREAPHVETFMAALAARSVL